jgi:UDP-2-acetamido-2,6-beta-L-arabino-hexul-4-ose reductase
LCNYEKKKLIYFSSIHYHRNDLYGFSKRYNEYLFSKEEFITKNQSFIIRTPGIFGPGSKPNNVSVVSTFCYNIVNKIQSKITDPEKVLEIYYIDDLVSEIINLFENNKHYNVIQLNSEQITVKQLFKLIEDISINNFSAIEKLYSTNFIDNITKTFNSFKNVTK